MENNPVAELGQDLKKYVQVQIDLLRLQLVAKIADASSSVVMIIVIALIAFMMAFFVSFTLGLYLSSLLGSYTKGFGIVALLFLFKLLLILFFGKSLVKKPIRNRIIASALKEKEDEDED